MNSSRHDSAKAGGGWIRFQLLALLLLLGTAFGARAEDCSQYPGGILDGATGTPAPSQLYIDRNCTIRNYPASNPFNTNISFSTQPGQTDERWLVIFDNVVHTGQMSCNAVAGHRIWFTNGSSTGIHANCQNLFIPVEKIDKQVPAGQTTATVGVPFTYTLTMPVLFDPYTGTVINYAGSVNDLHSVTLTDDLNATGADLTYLSHVAYWKDSGAPVPHSFTNVGGVLTFDAFPIIPAGAQIIIEITVVLDDSPANAVGTQFVNTAKWDFGRLIDDIFYEPLPGEWGISPPLTIAAPQLVVAKTGPATMGATLNLGEWGVFGIDVRNTGLTDAWNVTILDRLPNGATGGMCDLTPEVLSAQVFAADGVTPAPGQGPLVPGTDFSMSYTGAPTCELSLTMLTAAGTIGPNERLIITYRTKLDADTDNGISLTNVAGATQWFNADSSNADRYSYTRTLTNGTVGTLDHEDAHTVAVVFSGFFFEKTVANLTSGQNPATVAAPGDTLRYTLRLQTTDDGLANFAFRDELDALNSPAAFLAGSLSLVGALPAGAVNNSSATGGAKGTGLIDISNLNLPAGSQLLIQFDIVVAATVADGAIVANQSRLLVDGAPLALSDDPNVNGQADPFVTGDEDPTRVVINLPVPPTPFKQALQPTATVGEYFTYRITVPESASASALYDVRIQDNLAASGANLRFVSLAKVSGPGTPENVGSDTNLVIAEDATSGIDIPAGQQLVIDITVELLNTTTNVRPLSFSNTATSTHNLVNGNDATSQSGGASAAVNMTVVEPVVTMTKVVNNVTAGKSPADPATGGDTLEYTLTVTNGGDSIARDVNITDILPPSLALVTSSAAATINGAAVPLFNPAPTSIAPNTLVWGRANGDDSLDVPVGGVLVLTYRVSVQDITGASIANSAWVDWTSLDGVYPVLPAPGRERTGAGCGVGTVVSPNTYCYGPQTATIATLDTNAIAKAVTSDTWDTGLSTDVDAIARVGDLVTYRLALTLREGQTHNVSVQDVLDPGLAFVDVVSINGDTTAPYADAGSFTYADIPAGNVPAADQTGTLTWTLGDIVNAVDDDATNDTLVIVYRARVRYGSAEPPPVTPTTTTLNNQATLGYTFADGVTPAPMDPTRMQAAASLVVRQPAITAITKTGTVVGPPAAGNGTQATPYVVDIVANTMNFSVRACNSGDAPAYGVTISDQFPSQLDETSVGTPVVTINGNAAADGVDYTYTPPAARGGQLAFSLLTPLDPGQCVTVGYDGVGFHPDVGPNQLWSNQATVGQYWSLPPSDAREYVVIAPVAPSMVWMTNNAAISPPAKVLASPASGEATIGEEVVYRITVPGLVVNAALSDVVVSDTLHPSLVYVGATATLGGNPLALIDNTTGNDVVLGIAQIPAGQQAVIELRARVANNSEANAGVSFTNSASYTYDAGAGGPPAAGGIGTTPTPLTIVEPLLAISKAAANLTNPGNLPTAGDVLRYTLTFPASTGAEYSGAFDLGILDSLSLGLAYQAGTATVDGAGNTIADPAVTGDGVTTPQTLTWDPAAATAAIDVPEGATVTVTYDVLVLGNVQALQELVNSAWVQWTGLDGVSTVERTGAGCPTITAPNDYCAGPATTTMVTEPPTLTFQKTVVTGATASPGDVVRYRLEVSNESDIPFNGFSLLDDLDQLNDPAMFVAGTLTLATALPAGATDNSNPSGGSKGTGLIDIGNLSLGAAGSATDTVAVEFTVQLAPVIANGTVVLNQAQAMAAGTELQKSDDPSLSGTEDPTRIVIESAPAFRVQKSSTDLTGDPNVLLAGETLRYTITIKNIGTDDAVDAELRDQVPVNTTYVAGSTTLNGAQVADTAGLSPLVNGMPINSPADPTPGAMPADASDTQANVATITFDVVVDPTVADGTVISNQGFVSSVAGSVIDQPSDDPATPIADDPTRDIVGNLPLLYAEKAVVLFGDQGSPGVVDPGDVLRYTITVQNSAATPATGLVLTDSVPANTTYVANTTLLNGSPYGQPDSGAAPLASGIALGTLGTGETAVVQFDLRVNDGTPSGTVISNQAVVASTELPDLLTDGDGNPATGPEPTVVVVGDVQQLSITKEVAVVGGGAAVAGATLEYVVRVVNIATVPAIGLVITDDLDASQPGQLAYVAGSATLNGSTAGVSFSGSTITADYASASGSLQPGQAVVLRFRAVLNAGLAIGTTVTNTGVATWNTPTQTVSASVSIDVGGVPGVGVVNGAAWHDANFDDLQDATERSLVGWSVQLYRDDQLLATALTDTSGAYRISGLEPNDVSASRYELRFRAPGAGATTAMLGRAASGFTNGLQQITDIVVTSGSNLQGLNLPIDPNGVVYNSVSRGPIAGATLTLLSAGSGAALPASCFDDVAQQGQVTLADGYYKFDVNFADPACPSGGDYLIGVTAPGTTYVAGYSQIIPPTSDASTPALSVPTCPATADDAIPGTALYCEAQPSEFAPAVSVPARSTGTIHHVHLRLDGSRLPGTSQIFNNHIPLDPELTGAVAISKTTPMLNVTRGQLVPYTITVNNTAGLLLTDATIVDRFPPGFTYVEGSARLDGVPTEPTVAGRELTWTGLSIAGTAQHTVQLLLAVGAGITEGEYVNRAQVVHGVTGNAMSGEATATVRVVPDPTFDCTDVTGKVFDDANRNGLQDDGEQGLAGVRVVTVRGLAATTDQYGRYHITCAVVPDEARGSNFVLKLDDRTLPSGFRLSTGQTQVKRATRGKALRFNFGASIHRVVAIDLADAAFEPGSTEIRIQWRPRIDLLLEELRKSPAVLRLSYVADVEDAQLVDRRLEAVRKEITTAWEAMNCCYLLTIEPEVFWRLGAPPRQPVVRAPESR